MISGQGHSRTGESGPVQDVSKARVFGGPWIVHLHNLSRKRIAVISPGRQNRSQHHSWWMLAAVAVAASGIASAKDKAQVNDIHK
jgi:hypothetical protein